MQKIKFLTVTLILLLVCSTVSYGKVISAEEQAQQIVDQANLQIDEVIASTLSKTDMIIEKYDQNLITLEEKNAKIEKLIEKMIDKTNKISKKAQKSAAKLGVTVECELIEVLIDGQVILVDPIFIVGT